jgi:hypothetical protein
MRRREFITHQKSGPKDERWNLLEHFGRLAKIRFIVRPRFEAGL